MENKKNKTLKPLVSIIIPAYNGAYFLEHFSIPSVISQSYKNWELIIVDDGSIDNTQKVVKKFRKKNLRIRYIYQENKGRGIARNVGIKAANGKLIAFLDADDQWLSEKLNEQIELLEQNKLDFINCKNWVCDLETGRIVDVGFFTFSSMLFRKKMFYLFCFFSEIKDIIEDMDLFMQWKLLEKEYSRNFKNLEMDKPLIVYYRHRGQGTDHSNLFNLKMRVENFINKYKLNKEADQSIIRGQCRSLANFKMLLGDKKGAQELFKQLLKTKFDILTFSLFIVSCFGVFVYKNFISFAKLIRKNFFNRLKVLKYRRKYPSYYQEVVELIKQFVGENSYVYKLENKKNKNFDY